MRIWLAALFLLLMPIAAAQEEEEARQLIWGVRVESQFAVEELWNPARGNFFDIAPISVAGFGEIGRWGAEVTLRTNNEFSGAVYYIMSAQPFFGLNSESRIGIRSGIEQGEFFIRAQATFMIYGSHSLP